MIDRYSITVPQEKLMDRFFVDIPHVLTPRYNAAPTQLLPVITNTAPEGISTFYWGTLPAWSKNKSLSEKIVNTPIEAIHDRPPLKKTLMKQRCIIPADGFFAWKQAGKRTFIPYRFVCKDQEIFSMAGIWEEYEDTEGNQIQTFSIVTVPANPLVATVHHRMPAILSEKEEKIWLANDSTEQSLLSVLTAYADQSLDHYTVSPRIRETDANVPSLIRPTPPADQFGNLTLFD
jgi:putative SOS response-associated peptidase YedK